MIRIYKMTIKIYKYKDTKPNRSKYEGCQHCKKPTPRSRITSIKTFPSGRWDYGTGWDKTYNKVNTGRVRFFLCDVCFSVFREGVMKTDILTVQDNIELQWENVRLHELNKELQQLYTKLLNEGYKVSR